MNGMFLEEFIETELVNKIKSKHVHKEFTHSITEICFEKKSYSLVPGKVHLGIFRLSCSFLGFSNTYIVCYLDHFFFIAFKIPPKICL